MESTKKRVKLLNEPTNIQTTYSKNEYERANIKQLNENMKVGKKVVTVGKANAFSKGRPLNPNNITERRTVTQENVNRLTKALTNMKLNKSVKRKRAINVANFNQMMRNVDTQRRINLNHNGGRMKKTLRKYHKN
jgi:hypothetical protein